MIEADVKKQKTIRTFKYDSVVLLNYVKTIFHDKPIQKYMEKRKYEQAVSECKKWSILIKTVVGRNINFLSRKLDHIHTDYGEIINASEISNGKYEIDYVWNESNNEKVPHIKSGRYHNIFLTDDDRSLSISRNFSSILKENFPNHKRKHNLSITLWHELNIKKPEFFLNNKREPFYDS